MSIRGLSDNKTINHLTCLASSKGCEKSDAGILWTWWRVGSEAGVSREFNGDLLFTKYK